jgi:hypothetical protein
MREFRTYGSVRGARGNPGPYRDPEARWFARRRLQVTVVESASLRGVVA